MSVSSIIIHCHFVDGSAGSIRERGIDDGKEADRDNVAEEYQTWQR